MSSRAQGQQVTNGRLTAPATARGVDGPNGRDVGRIPTRRLRLAPVAEDDEAELFALPADPRAFVEDSTDPLTDPAQMRWVLAQWRRGWERHGTGHLTVRAREGADLPVGLLGVVGLVPLASDAEPAGEEGSTGSPARIMLSAYWRLHPEATGLGVATEAMRAVLEALPAAARRGALAPDSGTAPHDGTATYDSTAPDESTAPYEIVAITDHRNTASLALASRLGFRPAPPERPVPGGRADDVLLLLDPPTTF